MILPTPRLLLLSLAVVALCAPGLAAAKAPAVFHCPVGNGRGYGYPANTRVTSLAIRSGEGISCSRAWGTALKDGHPAKFYTCVDKVLDRHARYNDDQMTCTSKQSYPPYGHIWVRWTMRHTKR